MVEKSCGIPWKAAVFLRDARYSKFEFAKAFLLVSFAEGLDKFFYRVYN